MSANKLLLVQPFSLDDVGGGSRILGSLLDGAPIPYLSVNTAPKGSASVKINERCLPLRPYLGRIEATRFARIVHGPACRLYASRTRATLQKLIREVGISHAHVIAHSPEFTYSFNMLADSAIDMTLTIHDDFGYTITSHLALRSAYKALERAWKRADRRIVISDAMGEHYRQSFSNAKYEVITDSLTEIACVSEVEDISNLQIYFMGLLHTSYFENFRTLALAASNRPGASTKLVIRGGHFPVPEGGLQPDFRPLVFGDQVDKVLREEFNESQLLYLPLPFGCEYESFTNYSLSTKMISYCGSGVPILYHGPPRSAAIRLLNEYGACISVTEPGVRALYHCLRSLTPTKLKSAAMGAHRLARQKFLRQDVHSRFWNYYASNIAVNDVGNSTHGLEATPS